MPGEMTQNWVASAGGFPVISTLPGQFPTLLEATRLSTPCRHIEEVTGKAIFDPLINRSGLNCRILQGGVVKVGDIVRNAE